MRLDCLLMVAEDRMRQLRQHSTKCLCQQGSSGLIAVAGSTALKVSRGLNADGSGGLNAAAGSTHKSTVTVIAGSRGLTAGKDELYKGYMSWSPPYSGDSQTNLPNSLSAIIKQ